MISAALAVLKTDEERNALSEIYTKNIKSFYSIAFSKLHNQQDTEDAIQDAFLAIAKNPKPFFSVSADKRVSYINVVIRNSAIKIWNKKHKIAENEIELDESILDEQISNEEKVLSDFSCNQILKFIGTMPEGVRAAVYLRLDLGLTNSDIANTLGISEEATRKRIARAINQIKRYMEDLRDE